jgi:hypothetical protein
MELVYCGGKEYGAKIEGWERVWALCGGEKDNWPSIQWQGKVRGWYKFFSQVLRKCFEFTEFCFESSGGLTE